MQYLSPDEATEFISLILDLYPQQNHAANNTSFIKTQVQIHLERMNQLGFETLQQRYRLIRNLNYTEAARAELKFFADALKYALSDSNSINGLRKKYIANGGELDTLPPSDNHLLSLQQLAASADADSEAATKARAELQALFKSTQ